MSTTENPTVLEDGTATYYLVGTAHVSARSVDDVCASIEEIRPDVVCVELCEARYTALTSNAAWRDLDIFKVIREGKTLFLLANLAIGAYQRRIGQKLGVKPGAELLAAIDKANEVGARVVLVDRDIHVTLKRTWANLRFRDKIGLLGAVLMSLVSREGGDLSADEVEELKEPGNLSEILAEFAEEFPAVQAPLIDERDQYLMSGIEQSGGERVVAVVGAAHVPGMKRWFKSPVDRDALASLPPPSPWGKRLKWIVPIAILAAFVVGYLRKDTASLQDMLFAWILPNSIMAAIFTAIAGAKPLSVVTAFLASPITSLNPLLGVGLPVGLLEAWLRKPTVEDCERIGDDVVSVRGLYRNPVTRILLVAVLATVGSAVGAWIGLSWAWSLLA